MKKKVITVLLCLISISCLLVSCLLVSKLDTKENTNDIQVESTELKTAAEIEKEYKESEEVADTSAITEDLLYEHWFAGKSKTDVHSTVMELQYELYPEIFTDDEAVLYSVNSNVPQLVTLFNYIVDYLNDKNITFDKVRLHSVSTNSNNTGIVKVYINEELYSFYSISLADTEEGFVQVYYVKE